MNQYFSRSQSVWLQIVFWLVYFIINMLDIGRNDGWRFGFEVATVDLLFLIVGVYFNVLWFIPKFLNKKKFYTYGASMLTLSVSISLGWVLLYYLLDIARHEPEVDEQENYLEFVFILSSFIHNLLLIIGISSVWIIFDRYKTKERLQEVEKNQIESQLNMLKAQINPHFLFNVLNSAHFLIPKQPEKASLVLGKLSEILQFQLYRTSQEQVRLQDELMQLKNYIDLEKIRQGKQLHIDTNLENVTQNPLIEPFIFLPLVENAFKHSRGIQQSKVKINCDLQGNQLTFKIVNSVPRLAVAKPGGIGIPNLEKRLELLYPNAYNYQYRLSDYMYTAQLTINLNKEQIDEMPDSRR
ncbi:hypothetical protein BKI52_41360 [marine bacterium AO1-C]|nr:hypothetical protein BKI52_41360 [marine bacterium AO1-C]